MVVEVELLAFSNFIGENFESTKISVATYPFIFSSTVSMQNNFVSLFAIRDKALKDGDEELVKKIDNIYWKENRFVTLATNILL